MLLVFCVVADGAGGCAASGWLCWSDAGGVGVADVTCCWCYVLGLLLLLLLVVVVVLLLVVLVLVLVLVLVFSRFAVGIWFSFGV